MSTSHGEEISLRETFQPIAVKAPEEGRLRFGMRRRGNIVLDAGGFDVESVTERGNDVAAASNKLIVIQLLLLKPAADPLGYAVLARKKRKAEPEFNASNGAL